ncbi:MAG: S-methyl-5-thioribose-1-phosphate isomerase [Desulfobacterota bacterium]|nr:S-methyl-5-thioribose-1-phosphate isomerase [Thermodesulfobacteriota bacterium]MDW8001616.1 S-methyl-5-thioribose-1-phosphate isomerase [Deltaproteobacteria bacterium]
MSDHIFLKDEKLFVLDQRRLPFEEVLVPLKSLKDFVKAIKNMVVRGAPLIGIVGAYGFAFGVREVARRKKKVTKKDIERIYTVLAKTRPTAYNLFWALDRMKRECERHAETESLLSGLFDLARLIHEEDIKNNISLAEHGAALIEDGDTILSHCNAGELATGGYGTALGVLRRAKEQGKNIKVFLTETRPYFQGARLSAYELNKFGIEFEIVPDNHVGLLMSKGMIEKVIVGADRVAANGDTANKIGTYMIALCAKNHNVPFYVACCGSTFDRNIPSGSSIPIEERKGKEVIKFKRGYITMPSFKARYYSFDITPNSLITGFITEKGIIERPFDKIATIFG